MALFVAALPLARQAPVASVVSTASSSRSPASKPEAIRSARAFAGSPVFASSGSSFVSQGRLGAVFKALKSLPVEFGFETIRAASSNDLRNGTNLVMDGQIYKVLEFLHVKPGKGAAFVRTKLKNMSTGSTVEKTFRAGEPVETAQTEKKEMQHTYKEGEEFVFMDMETYEEARLSEKDIGAQSQWLSEGMTVNVLYWNETVLDVELPTSIVLEITYTEPGVKGNTATGATKPATVSTGAIVQVPLFIEQGEKIKIDTRSGEYLSRA
eukprot:tig00000404_g396.t1